MSGTREVSPTKTRRDPIKDDTSSQCWANVCWDGSATGPALYHLHGLACLLPVILWKPMQKESSWCRGHTQMLGHHLKHGPNFEEVLGQYLVVGGGGGVCIMMGRSRRRRPLLHGPIFPAPLLSHESQQDALS